MRATVGANWWHQAKVTLVEKELALDGAEREEDTSRPVLVEPAQSQIDALNKALSELTPTHSALQDLLNEKLR